MKNIKIYATIILMCLGLTTWAQGAEPVKPDSTENAGNGKDKRPVRSPFACGSILNNQTTVNLKKKTLEMMMQHRFGTFDKGYEDLWGVFGAANIRIGFDYGIIDRIQAGFGVTKNGMFWDFCAKGSILQQTRSNSMPLSVTYFGNIAVSAKKDETRYKKGAHRMSYFHQVIVSRKFADWFSVQVAASYIHYNIVDSVAGTNHDNFAVSASGRFRVSPQSSVLIEFDYPLTNTGIDATETKPNLGLGWEIATSSHAFQIFVASANGIIPQQNIVYNSNDFTKPKQGLILGFNITRKWGFTK